MADGHKTTTAEARQLTCDQRRPPGRQIGTPVHLNSSITSIGLAMENFLGGWDLDRGRRNLLVDDSYVNERFGRRPDGNFPKALSALLAVRNIPVWTSSVSQLQPFNFLKFSLTYRLSASRLIGSLFTASSQKIFHGLAETIEQFRFKGVPRLIE